MRQFSKFQNLGYLGQRLAPDVCSHRDKSSSKKSKSEILKSKRKFNVGFQELGARYESCEAQGDNVGFQGPALWECMDDGPLPRERGGGSAQGSKISHEKGRKVSYLRNSS